jgi:hypothetical protein
MDLFEKLKSNRGPLGSYAKEVHGYFTFPKLEGEIGPRMVFRGKECLNWSLNNYLGLANHPEVRKADADGAAQFGNAQGPAGCYPRDQLTPSELLPSDVNSTWAQQNPMGTGSLKGKNFLSAGALIGINTVGQSLRNANLQLRSEPPNPQVPISVFNVSTIEPDLNRRDLEIN